MKLPPRFPLARLLLGLLTLGVVLAPLAAAPTVRADDPKITLEAKWLLLRKEDGSDFMVQEPDKATEDGRALLTERRFVPNWKGSGWAIATLAAAAVSSPTASYSAA